MTGMEEGNVYRGSEDFTGGIAPTTHPLAPRLVISGLTFKKKSCRVFFHREVAEAHENYIS